MNNLHITNSNFITFKDDLLTIDVLGGVDVEQVEKMICTLRVSHKDYPHYRTTLYLYNDSQSDKLIRTLCDKYELQLLEVSKSINALISQLEEYRLENLKHGSKTKKTGFEWSEEDKSQAIKKLKHKFTLLQFLSILIGYLKSSTYWIA